MRKVLLLLTPMTLALLLAAGVALAATVTCKVGVACNGTTSADTITGTTSNDTIKGLGGNDTIKALDGIDKINGGPKNDTMNGGPGNDTYQFANFWGADRISADSAGVDTLTFAPHTQPYTSFPGAGVSASLVGDGSTLCPPDLNPCYTIQGSFIENLIGSPFTDALYGNEFKNQITSLAGGSWDPSTGNITSNEYMDGQAGADTYKGYAPSGPFGSDNGVDLIQDTGGSTDIDKLILTGFNLADVTFHQWANTPGSANIDSLYMILPDGELIFLGSYFQGTSTDACANAAGTGLVESISFADDPNVDFAQVKERLGCSAAGSVQDHPANDAATGTMQEGPQPQSLSQPESSSGTNGGVAINVQK
jgi:Ca2+-binding RTX toxin-like protein